MPPAVRFSVIAMLAVMAAACSPLSPQNTPEPSGTLEPSGASTAPAATPTPVPSATPTPLPTEVAPVAVAPEVTPIAPSAAVCTKPLPAGITPGEVTTWKMAKRLQPDRPYRVYFPPVPVQGEIPLVFDFHALASSAEEEESESGFMAVAREHGFILVTPQGSGVPKGWFSTDRLPDLAGDLDFVDAMLERLTAKFCIDQSRVYATGLSNGAFMASMLACERGERFAAVAPVAGVSFPDKGCDTRVAILAMHGTSDGVVPYDGGRIFELVDYDGAEAGIARWARHNRCTEATYPRELGPSLTVQKYLGCARGAETAIVVVEGGGHGWPTAAPELIWDFFSRQEREAS